MRKRVQDVGQHQFLVLLLVIETDFDQRHEFGERVLAGLVKEFHDRGVDVPAIGGDLFRARTGEVAALVAGVARTGTDIIGIEQIGIIGMEGLVIPAVLAEQELLEEPGGMGAVPFCRACVWHRLDQLILRGQRGGSALGLVSHREISFRQILGQSARLGE